MKGLQEKVKNITTSSCSLLTSPVSDFTNVFFSCVSSTFLSQLVSVFSFSLSDLYVWPWSLSRLVPPLFFILKIVAITISTRRIKSSKDTELTEHLQLHCRRIMQQVWIIRQLSLHLWVVQENWVKFILIQECQHKSTRLNTNKHESTRVQYESTRVPHESPRINTSPTRVKTNKYEYDTSQHESNTS